MTPHHVAAGPRIPVPRRLEPLRPVRYRHRIRDHAADSDPAAGGRGGLVPEHQGRPAPRHRPARPARGRPQHRADRRRARLFLGSEFPPRLPPLDRRHALGLSPAHAADPGLSPRRAKAGQGPAGKPLYFRYLRPVALQAGSPAPGPVAGFSHPVRAAAGRSCLTGAGVFDGVLRQISPI